MTRLRCPFALFPAPMLLIPFSRPLPSGAISPPDHLRNSQQHVLTLGHHLASSAALLTELARLSTGVGSALRGDAAPLVYSRPAVLLPDGECPAAGELTSIGRELGW